MKRSLQQHLHKVEVLDNDIIVKLLGRRWDISMTHTGLVTLRKFKGYEIVNVMASRSIHQKSALEVYVEVTTPASTAYRRGVVLPRYDAEYNNDVKYGEHLDFLTLFIDIEWEDGNVLGLWKHRRLKWKD